MSPHPALLTALLFMALASACKEEKVVGGIDLPSGRVVTLIDVITTAPGPEGATARFRFLAPGLTEADAESAAADMQALCDSHVLPKTRETLPEPRQIVISLSAEVVPFGEAAPDVVQFFEAYRPEGEACLWQPF
jgi:Family of unknown function (DUF6497)